MPSEKITTAFDESERTGKPVDIGNAVICDVCDEDFTTSDRTGGFLFGSYAYCPGCAVDHMPRIQGYGEEGHIKARCLPGELFRDFVLRMRGGNNSVQVVKFS